MKLLISLVFIFQLTINPIISQILPDGSIAPDFTLTDVNGVTHNLYDDLDAGYNVIIDFCASWCAPCLQLKESGVYEDLMDTYGPAGSDVLKIYLIEADPNTPLLSLDPFIQGANYYIFNAPTYDEADLYGITSFPTSFVICPLSKTIVRMINYLDPLEYTTQCPEIPDNGSLVSLEESYSADCNGGFIPSFSLRNDGSNNITSALIEFSIEGELIESYNWTGSLLPYESDTINLNPILVFGEKDLHFEIKLVNNTVDLDPLFNNLITTVGIPISTTDGEIIFNIDPGSYPQENYWALTDELGNIVYEGGNTNLTLESTSAPFPYAIGTYPQNEITTENIILPSYGCYTFTLIDTYGDGVIDGSSGFNLSIPSINETILEGYIFRKKSVRIIYSDPCFDIQEISCGQTTTGTTIGLTSETMFICDEQIDETLQGAWFSFEYNGQLTIFNTCSPNTDFDTELHVFARSPFCDDLVCLFSSDGGDGSCPDSDQALLEMPEGMELGTYFLWVTAALGEAPGNFELTQTCCPSTDVMVSTDNNTVCSNSDIIFNFQAQPLSTIKYLFGGIVHSININANGTNSATHPASDGNSLEFIDIELQGCTLDISSTPAFNFNVIDCNCNLPTDCGGVSYDDGIIYVKHDAEGANNGSSWTDAFVSLREAINIVDLACDGTSTIWIAEGNYPSNECLELHALDRLLLISNPTEIYGGFQGTETSLSERNDCFDPGSTVIGLFSESSDIDLVDQIFLNTSSLLLDGLTIDGFGYNAGGIRNESIDNGSPSELTINNCIIRNSRIGITNVSITGGASTTSVYNSQIVNNQFGVANAIFTGQNNSPVADVVVENTYIKSGPTFIAHYSFDENSNAGLATYTNCTFDVDFVFRDDGPGLTSTNFNNCVIWHSQFVHPATTGNPKNIALESCMVNNESCADLAGNYDGIITFNCANLIYDEDIEFDELFKSEEDLRPAKGSPLINGGNNAIASTQTFDIEGQVRILGTNVDIGAYEGASSVASNCNDISDPINIQCGEVAYGNTTEKLSLSNVPSCITGANQDFAAHWYSYTGTGDYIYASVCNPDLDFAPAVYIYSGTLGNLTCLGISYDACDANPGSGIYRTDAITLPGEIYYIMVGGYTPTDKGSYVLSITCQINDLDQDGFTFDEDLCPYNADRALHFDNNTNTINDQEADYISLPAHAPNDQMAIGGNFSMAAWIYPTEDHNVGTVISTPTINWSRSNEKMQIEFLDLLDVEFIVSGAATISKNEWHHVAVVVEEIGPGQSELSFYLNGDLEYTETISHSGFNTFDMEGWFIGAKENQDFYDGKIDALSVWKKAICPAKPAQLMAGIIDESDPDLLHFFNFNQGPACGTFSHTILSHHASSSLNGTLHNFGNSSQYDCRSNWTSSSNTDSDQDGFADGCNPFPDDDFIDDCIDLCPNSSAIALDFNSSGTPDYVVVYDSNNEIHLTQGDFSFQAWVNVASSGYNTVLSKGNGANPQTEYIFQVSNDGKLGLYLGNGAVADWEYSSGSIPLNEWHHIAVSVDNTSADTPSCKFFIDGVLDSSNTFDANLVKPLYDTNDNLFIGRQGTVCSCNFFHGKMDDLSIWNRQLTEAEILACRSGNLQGTELGLFAYYKFNGGPPCLATGLNVVNNISSNSLNGTLINFNAAGCTSDWVPGRNTDSDGDGVGDDCDDVILPCPGDIYLYGVHNGSKQYKINGVIQSDQTIVSPNAVEYSSDTEINLNQGFEAQAGASFDAYIEGCDENEN